MTGVLLTVLAISLFTTHVQSTSGLLDLCTCDEPTPRDEPVRCIDVMLFGVDAIIKNARTELRKEASRILCAAGVAVRWIPTDQLYEAIDGKLPLRATVTRREPVEFLLDENAMGVTTADKRGHIFLFYSSILRTLGIRPEAVVLRTRHGRGVLARAIARVLVHELVHYVAPHQLHTQAGLMKGHLTTTMLTQPDVALDPPSQQALVAGLERLRLIAGRD